MKLFILIATSVIYLGNLAGCHSSNSNVDNNQLKKLSSQKADSESSLIGNTSLLQNDINALFNGVDPVEVETGDSLQDVINRSGGS